MYQAHVGVGEHVEELPARVHLHLDVGELGELAVGRAGGGVLEDLAGLVAQEGGVD